MVLLFTVFLVGFFLGAVTVIGLEVLGVWFLIKRLTQKNSKVEEAIQAASKDVDLQQPLEFASHKEGDVWVLEAERVPKTWLEKVSREHERKKKFFEVTPVRKHAIIKDYRLILTESDGSPSPIPLKGCSIEAVSATDQSTKKWAKKFPIKLESKTSALYHGSRTLYIYLETSWEKESWCKALRYASSDDKKALSWFSKSQVEFKTYVMSLRDGYLSFMKPQAAFHYEPINKENRMVDDSSSKVRLIWNKISRKVSKVGIENRSSLASLSGRKDKRTNDKSRAHQDCDSASGSGSVQSSMSLPRSGSHSQFSTISDADSEDRILVDEGTLSWNLLISRLFFDIKSGQEIKRSIQERIQRTLSNMRIPSYIGEMICTNIYPGTLPPYIHSMRVLPLDMNDVWAFEIDFEYSGGLVLEIETRVDVCDLDPNQESNTDLLEGLEQFGKQFDLSEGNGDELEHKGELGDEGVKGTTSNTAAAPQPAAPNTKSRWKSIVNSIARHVSQVPISLRISVTSLRGTLRLHIKPPPSDQLWYGFTSMPEIDFNLDSSFGEQKITSGHVAFFLVNRFKAAIRETMVLPNCESVCIPFMLAEKNDWVPRKSAPFIWVNQESSSSSSLADKSCSQPSEPKPNIDHSKKSVEGGLISKDETTDAMEGISNQTELPIEKSESLQDLTEPLLTKHEPEEDPVQNAEIPVNEAVPRSVILHENLNSNTLPRSVSVNSNSSGEDLKSKLGRKARMLDLKKKMGEKIEEKRRNIEEKGRNIVEKMRGPP